MSNENHIYIFGFFLYLVIFLFITGCSPNAIAPVSTPANKTQVKKAPVKKIPVKETIPDIQDRPSDTEKNRGVYIVKKGDTLYSIAWNYGFDYRELARWNNIKSPYVIYPAQNISLIPVAEIKNTGLPEKQSIKTGAEDIAVSQATDHDRHKPVKPAFEEIPGGPIKWSWPTRGELVNFNTPIAKKGINIAGKIGQVINASAGGQVVYSGSGLLGYGKLIIIKHSETYLSAYAHNNKLLVKEGEKIASGQQIAEMGVASNGQALLHFEIRKNGQPDDPLRYLPKI